MHAVAFPKGTEAWSRLQANTMLRMVEERYQRADLEALVNLFTEDCVVRFGELPEQQGRVALRQLLSARLSRLQDFRPKRTCIAIDGNKLAIRWEGGWTDRETGKRMHGFGLEMWTMRDGKIAVWEAAFNAWEDGTARIPAAA